MKRAFLLLCISASAAFARPGETSGQVQERFGEPLTEKVTTDPGKIVGSVQAPAGGRRISIRDDSRKEQITYRLVTANPLTTSMRETSRVHQFGKFKIAVHFFDNRSQREAYKKSGGRLENDEVEQILSAASNGAPWAVEANEIGAAKGTAITETAFQNGRRVPGNYKANGLRAWIQGADTLIVETDSFRELRLAQPAKKPEPQFGQPIPGKGKGF